MKTTFNMRESSLEIGIPKIGRNKLYKILKLLDIVDHLNRPEQAYIDGGLLALPEPKINALGWHIRRNVTLVVEKRGLEFVKVSVLNYLKDNPMPKFPHRTRVRIYFNFKGYPNAL